jgi:uncharacterized protein (UPF0264 family)
MTQFLASVRSREEAAIALEGGADIIDLKDPAKGALGALDPARSREIVRFMAGRRPLSATVGDLRGCHDRVREAVARTAALGVDFVKVGLFDAGIARGRLIARLAPLAEQGVRLVAVLFADRDGDPDCLDALGEAGFAGAMLDTAEKSGGNLRCRRSRGELRRFIAAAHAAGLFCGLAGSLRIDDVAPLLGLEPDYLGFRGSLCGGARTTGLDAAAVRAVRARIPAGARRGETGRIMASGPSEEVHDGMARA